MSEQWSERNRPLRLERRYVFPDYATLRTFLDRAAALSEQTQLYPDIGFGRDYVNVTIYAEEGKDAIDDDKRRFAEQLDALARNDAGN